MKFYDETKPLYKDTNVSGVALGATLLQTRSNTSCHKDEAPNTSLFRLIAFARKCPTRVEKDTAI